MQWLSWQMMKRMKYQPWVGLPNILLNDFAVPELLQDDATPAALAQAAFSWLDNRPACEALAVRFAALHRTLQQNTAVAATHAIEKILAA
jgi:lipid-A-disaccharide synthase